MVRVPSISSSLHRLATLAIASGLAACHGSSSASPSLRPSPSRLVPVAGYCGQRSAIAVSRGLAPRRPSTHTGALVVRVTPADDHLTPPEGPVRVTPASRGAGDVPAAQLVALSRQVGRIGPLPAGHYVVEASGPGYQPRRFTDAVRPGATDTLRIRLAAACVRRASR